MVSEKNPLQLPPPQIVTVAALRRMSAQRIDALPSPAKRGNKRLRWDRHNWEHQGPADGTEPLEITDD
jgi:hypothetical protein|tara:strand:- start:44 stop:247 length:204 start_codon:yes stop_codon:yes gene_type:complete